MKALKYILGGLSAVALVSCNDFLTEDSRGDQNLDTYFLSDAECAAYVAGCYNNIAYSDWWQIENPWMVFEAASDDLWAGNTSQECDFYNVTEYRSNMAENGAISNFWQYRYKGILNTNVGLERIADAPIVESNKERYMAELRFLRAFYYFDLVKNFGGVPLIQTFAMPDQIEGITRTPAAEVYEWIKKELTEVSNILPERSQYSAAEAGHATRGAALGILAKAHLYTENWSEAAAAAQKVIDSGEYQLLSNFGQVWSIHHNNSVEGIFEVQRIYDATYALGSSLPTVTGSRNGPGDGWSWFQPTSDLENAFIAAGDTERLRWSIIKSGCTEIAGEDRFNEFVENNGTLDQNQLAQWEERYGFDASNSYVIRPDQHKSARIIRKFFLPLNDRPEVYNVSKSPLNYRIMRYADILLIAAEAYNELGQDDKARTYLNQVRNRAGLNSVTVSGQQLREAIRLERRLELCFEQNRLYDLRRWKDQSGKRVIENVLGPNGSFVRYNATMSDPYEADNQIESSLAKGAGFNANIHMVFPIPNYEIQNSNGSIEQNPGY